jgi:hypothetical protein
MGDLPESVKRNLSQSDYDALKNKNPEALKYKIHDTLKNNFRLLDQEAPHIVSDYSKRYCKNDVDNDSKLEP